MSRLLLYKPVRLRFKRYTATALAYIDEFPGTYSEYRIIPIMMESGRIDLIDRICTITNYEDYATLYYYMGFYMSVSVIKNYLSKSGKYGRCIINGALSRNIDTVCACVEAGYNFSTILDDWRPVSKKAIDLAVRIILKSTDGYIGNLHSLEQKLKFTYDSKTAKKLYKHLSKH